MRPKVVQYEAHVAAVKAAQPAEEPSSQSATLDLKALEAEMSTLVNERNAIKAIFEAHKNEADALNNAYDVKNAERKDVLRERVRHLLWLLLLEL